MEPHDFFRHSSRNDVPGRLTATTAPATTISTYDFGEDQRKRYLAKEAQKRAYYDKHYLPLSQCGIEDLEFDFRTYHSRDDEDSAIPEPTPMEPGDVLSPHPSFDMPSSNTSDSLVTSPSNSDVDPDTDRNCRFPVASNRFWTSQDTWPDRISHTTISHGPPGILCTSSWTPRMMMTGRSRVRSLVGHNDSPTDVCTQLLHDISDVRRSISRSSKLEQNCFRLCNFTVQLQVLNSFG